MTLTATRKLKKGLAGVRSLLRGYPLMFDYTKKEVLDLAFNKYMPGARSFADLGGVWRIDGAYTFYLLDSYNFDRSFLVDTNMTHAVRQRGAKYSNLALIENDFSEPEVMESIAPVDAIILFDILLHQVQPDWNEILKSYSQVTQCFIIYNQQFIAGSESIRLPDLGREEYFKRVPMSRKSLAYRNLFERPHELHPKHKKPWRDIHNVWQWGITDNDLIDTMEQLGFVPEYRANVGQFSNFTSFENHAFIFLKGNR